MDVGNAAAAVWYASPSPDCCFCQESHSMGLPFFALLIVFILAQLHPPAKGAADGRGKHHHRDNSSSSKVRNANPLHIPSSLYLTTTSLTGPKFEKKVHTDSGEHGGTTGSEPRRACFRIHFFRRGCICGRAAVWYASPSPDCCCQEPASFRPFDSFHPSARQMSRRWTWDTPPPERHGKRHHRDQRRCQ